MTRVFLLTFEVALMLRLVILYSLIDSRFDSLLFSLIVVMGAVVFLTNAVQWWTDRTLPNIWLMVIILAMLVSTVFVPEAQFVGNLKMVAWQGIYFFVVFYIAQRQDDQLLKWFENVMITFWTVAIVLSLFLFFIKFTYTAPLTKIYYGMRLGIVQNRLYGIFVDPNYAANLSLIVSILLIKRWATGQRRWPKTLYVINLLLQFFYIALSGSRSGLLDMVVVVFVGLFLVMFGNHRQAALLKRWGMGLATGLIGAVLIVGAQTGVKKVLPHLVVPTKIAFIDQLAKDPAGPKDAEVSLAREDVGQDGDSSNGRLGLWKSAWQTFETSPIYGGSPNNWIDYTRHTLPKSYIARHGQTPHNFIFLTLAATGLLGLIPLLGFLIMKAIQLIRALFKTRGMQDIGFILMALIPIDMILFASLMPDLIYENRIGGLCFWLFLGIVTLGKQPGSERNDFHIGNYSAR